MKLTITRIAGTPLTRELIGHIEQRAEVASKQFGEAIREIKIGMVDLNGPRGGVDKRCQLQFVYGQEKPLVVTETNRNIFAAVNRAFSVATQFVRRRIKQRHQRIRAATRPDLTVPALITN